MITFAPLDGTSRGAAAQRALASNDCDALLVTSLINIGYLTGFRSSAGRLVVLPDELVLVLDGRYADEARAALAASGSPVRVVEGRTQRDLLSALTGVVAGVRRLGLEAAHVTWESQQAYAAAFDVEVVATTGIVEEIRRRKEPGEVARIEAACDIASAALADVIALLDDEPTEIDFRDELELAMRRRGADGPSFDSIVASGPSSARPHHRPDTRRIRPGDLVVIDYGCIVDGYCSDMTRTAIVGEPSAEQRELIELVTASQAAGVAAVRPGLQGQEVDAVCRAVIVAAGHGEGFVHGTGHGVGLQIHEDPFVVPTVEQVLEVGNVITVEPGVYRYPLGGVRVEDTLLVTEDGCRPLTKTPKDLACLRLPPTT